MTDENSDLSRPPEGDWLGSKHLRFERHGSIAWVTVDRPHRRNALTVAMYFGIRYAIDRVNHATELAGLIITGTGDVFIPGGDLGGEIDDEWPDAGRLFGMDATPFEHVRNSRKPVVCAVNGLCQGGGLLIAMLSDIAVAVPEATFRAPEVLRGIGDTYYAEFLTTQIGPARARDMLLSGRTLDAATAQEWGLITRLVERDDLEHAATEAITDLCHGGPHARSIIKREINRQYGRADRMSMEESVFGGEYAEGFEAFKQRRSPTWVPDDLRREGRL